MVVQSYVNTTFPNNTQAAHHCPGNVLAYENYVGQTIVLKSGNFFPTWTPPIEKLDDKVIVVPLEDIVAIVGSNNLGRLTNETNIFTKYKITEQKLRINNYETAFQVSGKEIKNYFDLATEYQDDAWKKYYKYLHNDKELEVIRQEMITAVKSPLMSRLNQLRHTEFQVQALLTRYNTMKTEPRSDIKEIIKLLLPRVLVVEKDCQHKIYSLFEACKSCKQANWLQNQKQNFMCYVLDGQIQETQNTTINTGTTRKIILTPPLNQKEVEQKYAYVP